METARVDAGTRRYTRYTKHTLYTRYKTDIEDTEPAWPLSRHHPARESAVRFRAPSGRCRRRPGTRPHLTEDALHDAQRAVEPIAHARHGGGAPRRGAAGTLRPLCPARQPSAGTAAAASSSSSVPSSSSSSCGNGGRVRLPPLTAARGRRRHLG